MSDLAHEDTSGFAPELVSVIIPNLNGANTLGAQFEALAGQTYRGKYEVIVADNGSTDDIEQVVEDWKPRIPGLRMIDASQRRGSSHARNIGALTADGDFLVFCDSDDIVAPLWIEAMAEASREFDLVGGWLETDSLNDEATRATRRPAPRDRLPEALGFLPFTGSGNCGVRSTAFRDLGGWNETYIIGCMDIEFCWRAALSGYRLGFAPDAVIHYRWRSGLRPLAKQSFRWGSGEAHLFRDFRSRGMARSNTRAALVEWAWIVVHVVDLLREPKFKGSWVRKASNRWGRVVGSIRYRVLFL